MNNSEFKRCLFVSSLGVPSLKVSLYFAYREDLLCNSFHVLGHKCTKHSRLSTKRVSSKRLIKF